MRIKFLSLLVVWTYTDICRFEFELGYSYKIDVLIFHSFHFRCFCELSRQIGFSNTALKIFEKQQTLGLYRNIVCVSYMFKYYIIFKLNQWFKELWFIILHHDLYSLMNVSYLHCKIFYHIILSCISCFNFSHQNLLI